MIHECDGQAIIAHPYEVLQGVYKINLTKVQLENVVKTLINLGIDGIEVYNARYTDEQVEFLEKLANQYNLIKTVGSDFHGKSQQEFELLEKGDYTHHDLKELQK